MEIRDQINNGKASIGIEFGSTRIKAILVGEDLTPIASGAYDWENSLENGIWTYSSDMIHNGIQACYKALKADVQAKLTEQHTKQADAQVDEALIGALIEKLNADIPECMFDNEVENFVRDYDNRLRMNGLDLQTYFKYTGLDLDKLREQMRPDAERQVKTRLALEKIAALENIAVSEEETEAEYGRLAEMYNMEADKVREVVAADAIAEDLKVKKAIELVREKAVITEVEKTDAE